MSTVYDYAVYINMFRLPVDMFIHLQLIFFFLILKDAGPSVVEALGTCVKLRSITCSTKWMIIELSILA